MKQEIPTWAVVLIVVVLILTSAILTSPHPHPLEQQNAHRVSLSLL
jgi:hypothetical protein